MCIKRKFKKTGIEYSPFEWRFNFSVKHLIAAKFISTEDNRILELTEKNRSIDMGSFDANRDVRAISE
ncbi:hypothetical protein GCM10011628_11130 [Lactobacillus acetotolerans DSM 20749 = JCM 3825]|nr:hypothetical protein GCM10011628_11130 [Lactobacillus acetotolerans DSM 20749 = JCM 3825]